MHDTYIMKGGNFGKSSFVNSQKWFVFNDALNPWSIIWKVVWLIDNDSVASVIWSYHDVWSEGWFKDLVNFTSASEEEKIDIFAPQVSTHAHENFYPEVESFTKNDDKYGWVKYWWMSFNLPKFSSATILLYAVC